MARLLVSRGAVAAAPPTMVAFPPRHSEDAPYRYLYVGAFTGGLAAVTIQRPHFPDSDIGNGRILDLGCRAQYWQPLTVIDPLGVGGTAELWVSDDRDEAYQLGRV